MASAEDTVGIEFYAPWPLLGKKFAHQLGEIRTDTASLAPVVHAIGLDASGNFGSLSDIERTAIQAWEIGEQGFHNRFRTHYDKSDNSYQIQYNSGTENVPLWTTYLEVTSAGEFYATIADTQASNIGAGTGIFAQKNVDTLEFKSLVEGTNIDITSDSDEVTIATTAEINTASNLGSGTGIFAQKSGVDLQFKSLVAGPGIGLSASSTEVTISNSDLLFYGISVKQTTGKSYQAIRVLAFDADAFYIGQNAPNTDEVVVSLREANLSDRFVDVGGDTMTGDLVMTEPAQIFLPAGSATDPPLTFSAETNSGLRRRAANDISIVVAGNDILRVLDSYIHAAFPLEIATSGGSASSPSLRFFPDSGTGIFQRASGGEDIAFATDSELAGWFDDRQDFYVVGNAFVRDDPYSATLWNGNRSVPTKNAVRDKFEALSASISTGIITAEAFYVRSGGELSVVGVRVPAGSMANPSITFVGDPNTGFFSQSPDSIGVVTDGATSGIFGRNGWRVDGPMEAEAFYLTKGMNIYYDPVLDYDTMDSPRGIAIRSGFVLTEQATDPTAPNTDACVLWAKDQQGHSVLHFKDNDDIEYELLRDTAIIARNSTGSTITKGSAVYISGSTGSVPTIALAKADSSTTMPSVGIANEDITNNSFGHVTIGGVVESIDTSAFSAGDTLWVSAATAGVITNTRPANQFFQQKIAIVITSGVGNGSILVSGDFSDLPSISTISDGVESFTDSIKLTFKPGDFYLTEDSAGQPQVNLTKSFDEIVAFAQSISGFYGILFKESEAGGARMRDDQLNLDSSFFYLSSGFDAKPTLSLQPVQTFEELTARVKATIGTDSSAVGDSSLDYYDSGALVFSAGWDTSLDSYTLSSGVIGSNQDKVRIKSAVMEVLEDMRIEGQLHARNVNAGDGYFYNIVRGGYVGAQKNGTQGSPAIYFEGQDTTGMFLNAVGDWRFTLAGASHLAIQTNGVVPLARLKVNLAGGAATTPSYTWNSDQDTGMYQITAGENMIRFSTAGIEAGFFNAGQHFYVTNNISAKRFIKSSRQTYSVTNLTTDRSYDADTVLVAELADVVGTLIQDLVDAGLIKR